MKPPRLLISVLISMFGLAYGNGDETNYFLVAEPPGRVASHDSYVLPLSKPEDLAHARYLISLGSSVFWGSQQPLVVAKIVHGWDGLNRNYLDQTFREWSWHVVEFRGFADFTIEILDGSPTDVETSQYAGWPLIGFWNYTVVRELGPHPLFLSIMTEGQRLELYWSGIGTNFVYTLESKDSQASTNWTPVGDATWPLKTNHWTPPLTNAPARFLSRESRGIQAVRCSSSRRPWN